MRKYYLVQAVINKNVLCEQIILAASKKDAVHTVKSNDGIISNLINNDAKLNVIRYNTMFKIFREIDFKLLLLYSGCFLGGFMISYYLL